MQYQDNGFLVMDISIFYRSILYPLLTKPSFISNKRLRALIQYGCLKSLGVPETAGQIAAPLPRGLRDNGGRGETALEMACVLSTVRNRFDIKMPCFRCHVTVSGSSPLFSTFTLLFLSLSIQSLKHRRTIVSDFSCSSSSSSSVNSVNSILFPRCFISSF